MKILSPLPLLLVAFALSACEDAAAPEGQPGDLTVAAYIDNDASGSLTAGDTPLANFEIAVLRDGQEVASGTTAGDGRVTFADLAPGSYVIEPGGPVPPGATLTSNPSPSAVIDFRGRPVSVDFRYAMFPGVVEGRVFRDENANGTFEQGTDVPGPGLWVFLRADTGAVGAKLDSVRTDSLGAYRFRLVPPGNYYLEFERAGTINYGASGATRQVSVLGAATTTLDVLYTGSIFITIAQARATAVDTTVAVIGDITAPPGVFTSGTGGVNSEIWVQDTTGGIAAFPVPTADSATLRLGTRIEVIGQITLFSGQRQIGRSAAPPTIRVRSGGAVVAPTPNTVAQARARGDEGELVRVSGLTVVAIGTGTNPAFNVTTVGDAGDTLIVRVNGAATGLTRSSFTVGEEYNVTGILTQFNGTAQVKPRFASDVFHIVRTLIRDARALAPGTAVTVLGNITAPPGVFVSGSGGVNSEIWVQDTTGGIAVFSVATADSATLRLGDRVEVSGTIGVFNGQVQITATSPNRPVVTRKFGNTIIAPKVITGAEANLRTDEGELVQVLGLTVTSLGTGTTAFTVFTTAPDGSTVQIRVAGAATGLARTNFVVGSTYDVTGILTQFNGTAQLKPRFRTDVNP